MSDAFMPPRPAAIPSRFMVALDAIDMGERLRPVDRDYVQALAASLSETGQINPVRLRTDPAGGNRLLLVAGAHRIEAARLLGWVDIEATLRDQSDDEARLDEIDENVFRRELSALDLAVSLTERKRLYEALHPEAAHGKAKKPKTEKGKVANFASFQSFAKDAARKTGLGERSVQDYVALAKALGPDLIASLRAAGLSDNAAQLKAVAALPEADRAPIVTTIAEGRAANVAKARVVLGHVPKRDAEQLAQEAFMNAMMRLELKQLRSRLAILQEVLKSKEAGAEGKASARAAAKAGKPKAGRP